MNRPLRVGVLRPLTPQLCDHLIALLRNPATPPLDRAIAEQAARIALDFRRP